ncbi:MAG: hypothetical protein KAI47_23420 [Deltaproteobacteria bacterium]|nr:hypothetical protein [Deltaproteobacteria bacterium]
MIYVILTTTVGEQAGYIRHGGSHRDYLQHLDSEGVLIAAGPFDDHSGGMILVRAASMAQAIEIGSDDPRVIAGVDRFQVRQWNHETFDALGLEEDDLTTESTALESDLGDDEAIPYEVVDAIESPDYAETVARCFAPKQIALGDPTRTDYLRRAHHRGLHKLLLRHEGEVIGQVEYAPPESAALPISGERVVVLHCLWVKDAFAGLDAGRQLLIAAAEANPEADSLATVAYNSELAWLPRSFFSRNGFITIDQIPTGRFFGDTQINAHLMWRPLRDGAARPNWNRTQLLEGVNFCPAYPWMSGKRLYWGHDFAYRAIIVREALRRPEILQRFPILGSQRVDAWNLVKVGIPAADLSRAVKLLQETLIEEPTYYTYVYATHGDELTVIFPEREFHVTRDSSTWDEAIAYGVDRGVPRDELVFTPFRFENEVFSDSI